MGKPADEGVYGALPEDLDTTGGPAIQFSPVHPGAERLEDRPEGSLSALTMLAPPGTIERRYAVALGLRALAPGAGFTVMAPKPKGGSRLGEELRRFGCEVQETAKRHHRICLAARPGTIPGLGEALEAGAPRLIEATGLWSQPGVFSWDREDPGSSLLVRELPALSGAGADFGCGVGVLSRAVLTSPKVKSLALIDLDRRALDAARRNVLDPRAHFVWADLHAGGSGLSRLDFVVMNPPFHRGGGLEDQALGQGFVQKAAESLRPGGVLWLTANRHLPYEAVLRSAFKSVTPRAEAHGFKIFEARR